MRVGINLFPLRPRIAGGLEFYVRNLLRSMFDRGANHSYFVITAPWNHEHLDFGKGPYQKILLDTGGMEGLWSRVKSRLQGRRSDLYRCIQELDLDLWFCPMMDLEPKYLEIPTVVTIPDLQHEVYPQFFSAEELSHRNLTLKASCQLASAVIAISEHSRKSIVEHYGVPSDKVHRIYLAAGQEYTPGAAAEAWSELSRIHNLSRGYLFYPANTWPHKNHELLLIALQLLKKRGLAPPLVLTGANTGSTERLMELATQFGCKDQIIHLGYVRHQFFPGLYHGAACLAFPSLFEGFGIPIVEAMSTGCPVACSNVCSIPEVAADAAEYFDPRKPEAIADSLERILLNEALRNELIQKGRKQAEKFSWARAADETLQLFDRIQNQRQSRPDVFLPPQDHVEGFYSDGWAGPRMLLRRVELGRWRELVLEGEISGACAPLKISACGDKSTLHELEFPAPGQFSKRIELPDRRPEMSLMDIEIIADRHFVPRKLKINSDTRRLSYKLSNLALMDNEGNSMVLRGR